MKKLILTLCLITISGCAWLQKPESVKPEVKIITEQVPVTIYQPPYPRSVELEDIKWFVITQDNLAEKIAELKKIQGESIVVFAMTPQSYENMSYNLQELRRYIRQQNEIIQYYQDVTKNKHDPETWKSPKSDE